MAGVSQGIVARYSLTLVATAHGIVPESITVSLAGRARSSAVINWAAQSVPD